jgi:hypothetical protein
MNLTPGCGSKSDQIVPVDLVGLVVVKVRKDVTDSILTLRDGEGAEDGPDHIFIHSQLDSHAKDSHYLKPEDAFLASANVE